jgi:hypothetical protein
MSANPASIAKTLPSVDLDEYFDRLFPDELFQASSDPDDNAIEQFILYVNGDMFSGKSNTSKLVVNQAVKHYGRGNVAVTSANARDFASMIHAKWEKKFCQILLVKDATKVVIPDSVLADFFTIRHIMKERTGLREGICVIVFETHRIQGTPLDTRTNYAGVLLTSAPLAKWDRDFYRNEYGIGKAELNLLSAAKEKREKGWLLITRENTFLGAAKIPRLSFATKVREIKGDEEIQVSNGKKGNPTTSVPVPRKETLLLLGMVLFPWLTVYVGIHYPGTNLLVLIALGVVLPTSYGLARFSRWLKSFRARRG